MSTLSTPIPDGPQTVAANQAMQASRSLQANQAVHNGAVPPSANPFPIGAIFAVGAATALGVFGLEALAEPDVVADIDMDAFDSAIDHISGQNTFEQTGENIGEGISEAGDKAKEWVVGAGENTGGFIDTAKQGLSDGINNLIGNVEDTTLHGELKGLLRVYDAQDPQFQNYVDQFKLTDNPFILQENGNLLVEQDGAFLMVDQGFKDVDPKIAGGLSNVLSGLSPEHIEEIQSYLESGPTAGMGNVTKAALAGTGVMGGTALVYQMQDKQQASPYANVYDTSYQGAINNSMAVGRQ